MKTQSIDTHPKVEEVLISLLRKATFSKKISQIRSLSQMAIQLSRRAIARANRNLNQEQIDLLFINYHYGEKLAKRVKRYLDKLKNSL